MSKRWLLTPQSLKKASNEPAFQNPSLTLITVRKSCFRPVKPLSLVVPPCSFALIRLASVFAVAACMSFADSCLSFPWSFSSPLIFLSSLSSRACQQTKMRSVTLAALGAAAIASTADAKVFFAEKFDDADWSSRWTVPTKWKSASDLGEWKWTAGKFNPEQNDKGIQVRSVCELSITQSVNRNFVSN